MVMAVCAYTAGQEDKKPVRSHEPRSSLFAHLLILLFFGNCRVWFIYMVLGSTQRALIIHDGDGRLGMMFEKQHNCLRIVNIAKGGVADSRGVQLGDTITGVNGTLLKECMMEPTSIQELTTMLKTAVRPVTINFNHAPEVVNEISDLDIQRFKEIVAKGLPATLEAMNGKEAQTNSGEETTPTTLYLVSTCDWQFH
jgi:hypothetical protein